MFVHELQMSLTVPSPGVLKPRQTADVLKRAFVKVLNYQQIHFFSSDFSTDLSDTSKTTNSVTKDFPEVMIEQNLCFHFSIPRPEVSAEVAAYADVAKQIIDLAVFGAAQNRSYDRLARFTDTIGNRVSGSHSLEMAIKYMYSAMTQDGLDVHLGELTDSRM